MRLPWIDGSRGRAEPLAWKILLAPLVPLALLYAAGAWLHRAAWRRGPLRPRRIGGAHVVAVGNLTVGGSAKTPAAAWLARSLRERGHRTALLSRGYGRRSRAPVVVVSDGRHVHGGSAEGGDEPLLLAGQAPGVPVLVGSDRALVGLHAAGAFGAELLVLDDAFQHHRLARDLDVVLVDGRSGFGNGWTLPRGPLREPLPALRFASAVGVVDGPLSEADEALLARHAPQAFRFAATRRASGVRGLGGGPWLPPRSLESLRVGVLSGIARPAALRRSVEALGARVVAERAFPDHHRYRPSDVRDLARQTPIWITTEKDALKIPASWVGEADVRVLAIALALDDPKRVLDWMEARLR